MELFGFDFSNLLWEASTQENMGKASSSFLANLDCKLSHEHSKADFNRQYTALKLVGWWNDEHEEYKAEVNDGDGDGDGDCYN